MSKGFGGLAGRDKSYNWSDYLPKTDDKVVNYIYDNYEMDEIVYLMDEYSNYLRYKNEHYEPVGIKRILKIIDIVEQKEAIDAMGDTKQESIRVGGMVL